MLSRPSRDYDPSYLRKLLNTNAGPEFDLCYRTLFYFRNSRA